MTDTQITNFIAAYFEGYGETSVSDAIRSGGLTSSCDNDDFQTIINDFYSLYNTYEANPCESNPNSNPSPCPSAWHPDNSWYFLETSGLLKQLKSLLVIVESYTQECFASDLASDLVSDLEDTVSVITDATIPGLLETKEGMDVVAILRHLYLLV